MSGATNGITWTKDGRGLSAGSVSSITVGSVEDFKCLHDRVVDLDKHTGDLVEGLKNLLGRLTGRQEEESSGQVPEIPRVSTETALSGAANNVGQALCLLEQLRRRLYGE